MTAALDGLLDWVGAHTGQPAAVARLAAALLQAAPGRPHATDSSLNNDGSPLQVCATHHDKGCTLRLIGDPGADRSGWRERSMAASQALADTLVLGGATGLAELCAEALWRATPPAARSSGPDGGWFWLAAGLEGGAAIYVNTRWGSPDDRWRDALGWLCTLLPRAQVAEALIETLGPNAAIASVALEGRCPADARAKLYWRLASPVSLNGLGVPLFEHPDCRAFLQRFVGGNALPLAGVVFSAGFSIADGGLTDAKIDLCAHCLPRSPRAWRADLEEFSGGFGLAPFDVADALEQQSGEVAFVGFGLDRRQRRRLNVYLKPSETKAQ